MGLRPPPLAPDKLRHDDNTDEDDDNQTDRDEQNDKDKARFPSKRNRLRLDGNRA